MVRRRALRIEVEVLDGDYGWLEEYGKDSVERAYAVAEEVLDNGGFFGQKLLKAEWIEE